MERLIEQYSGQRTLEFDNNESASVTYRIDDLQDFISDRWAANYRDLGTSGGACRGRPSRLAPDCVS
jgi:hypothetical protein